jgi:deoxyribodipyrimidine photolyase-related protein
LKISLSVNSYEGYIRQLIGWKQRIRYLYQFHYDKYDKKNFLQHKGKIPNKIWNGNTGIPPIDDCIKKAEKYSYLHHIERLMIIGQFFLIIMVNPKYVFKWFITTVSIDAYSWVMYPNVYGMIMYADGGFTMNRPYLSSSNYIKKMSNYNNNNTSIIKLNNIEYKWDEIWDSLYYNFLNKHYNIFKNNYALARSIYHWDNKTKDEQKKLLNIANLYLKYLYL